MDQARHGSTIGAKWSNLAIAPRGIRLTTRAYMVARYLFRLSRPLHESPDRLSAIRRADRVGREGRRESNMGNEVSRAHVYPRRPIARMDAHEAGRRCRVRTHHRTTRRATA